MSNNYEPRTKNFKIGTFHGKLNPEKLDSEAKIRNDLYLIGALQLNFSNKDKRKIRLLGYEVPLKKGTKRGECIDLLGFDDQWHPYIIELKTSNTSDRVEKIIKQINKYEDLFKNCMKNIAREVQNKFHWKDFKFSPEIKKIVLIPRKFYNSEKNKFALKKYKDSSIFLCSFSRLKDIKDKNGNFKILKLRSSYGFVALKIENK